jgi:hypothetical protein
LANDKIAKYGGQLSDPDIKGRDSWIRKVTTEYNGNHGAIHDSARVSIIHDDPQGVFNALKSEGGSNGLIKSDFKTHGSNDYGFEGGNLRYKMPNGTTGEIQVVSPDMVFAKDNAATARGVLGDAKYKEMVEKYGDIGGQGHKFYKEARVENDPEKRAIIANKSKNYYKQFSRY